MEQTQTTTPQLGAWDKLPTTEIERKPKVEFEIDKPVEVTFIGDEPVELTGSEGVYYLFHAKENGEEKVIMTSAWTLLRALKIQGPLKDKTLTIVKTMVNGKQQYNVATK
ncbi:hypothetical protein CMI42_03285 [Candidatus Pacearchaeota archaeon]|nr:hypothetical protein [Candidatus Pacearchaeota archaeon]|tara:strand:- start:1144 stop:1473 length:330 start_codon:yes stop_codon:yes gene_type:complete